MGQKFKILNIKLSNKIKKKDVELLLKEITEERESINLEISKVENDKDKASLLEDMEGINRQEEIVKKV